MSRIYFFATAEDILSVLKPLEMDFSVKYVEENLLAGSTPQIWSHVTEIPSLGYATGSQEITCNAYLIMRLEADVTVVSSVMMDGELRYDVYPNNNPGSVLLRPGGFWKDGSLISGHFISSSEQPFPRQLMNYLRRVIRKSFSKIHVYWVGPEALARLRSGKRLCTAIQSPLEYDLHESAANSNDAKPGGRRAVDQTI